MEKARGGSRRYSSGGRAGKSTDKKESSTRKPKTGPDDGDFTPPEAAAVSNFADNLNVNLYGVVRLVNAVLPGMRAAGGGRIVVTSSTVGLVALPMLPVYCTTKFAVEGYIESMAATYAPVGIHFSLVEPGPVGTPFGANAHAAAAAAPAELAGVAATFNKNSGDFMAAPQDAAECAKYHMRAITDAKPQLRYMTYEGLRWMVGAKYVDLTGTKTMDALATLTTPREESS